MSRLHAFISSVTDISAYFGVHPSPAIDAPTETSEGGLGLAILELQGRRRLKAMHWGFPRLTREMRERGDPPSRIGLVADLTNAMWEDMVVDPRYRCLIPITHFANPDGVPGEMTRTWFSLNDQPIMAWAGFCRNVPGYGPLYAGMTMTANAVVMPTNDRMPVLLEPSEHDRWLHGSIQDVIGFQFRAPISSERMVVEKTEDLWRSDGLPAAAAKLQPTLL